MRNFRSATGAALLVLQGLPLFASEWRQDYTLFQLFNSCGPFPSFVGELEASAEEIGLTRDEISSLVELRLRSDQLYSENGDALFYVKVGIHEQVFTIRTEFAKPLYDIYSDDIGYAPTWSNSRFGSPVGKELVLATISGLVELFVSEYRQVNAEACSSK